MLVVDWVLQLVHVLPGNVVFHALGFVLLGRNVHEEYEGDGMPDFP